MKRRAHYVVLLLTISLGLPAAAAPSAAPPSDRAAIERLCEVLLSRPTVHSPHAVRCGQLAAPPGAPAATSTGEPGSCRTTPGTAGRCPRRVAAAGSFSNRVTGGVLLPDGGAVLTGMDYTDRQGWRLTALRADGSKRWTRGVNGRGYVGFEALVDRGRGIVASGYTYTTTTQFVVRRYHVATGATAWTATPRVASLPESLGVETVLAKDGRTAFVAGYGHKAFAAARPIVVALDVASGRPRWRWQPEVEVPTGVYYLAMSPDGRTVYAAGETWSGGADVVLVALDARSGRQRWSREIPSPFAASVYGLDLSADGKALIVTGEDFLPEYSGSRPLGLAVDAATGEDLWELPAPATAAGQYVWTYDVAAARDRVYLQMQTGGYAASWTGVSGFARGGNTNSVLAVDSATGTVAWDTAAHPDRAGLVADSLIAVDPAGSRVYVAGTTSQAAAFAYAPNLAAWYDTGDVVVTALDGATGESLWRSAYGGAQGRTSAHVGDVVFARGSLHVFAGLQPYPRYAAPALYQWSGEGLWAEYDP